jgi:methionyl-tRNA formyltransferase
MRLLSDSGFLLKRQSKGPRYALHCHPRTSEDERIDWTKPAIEALRQNNASNKPYPGEFSVFEAENLILWGGRYRMARFSAQYQGR